MFLTDERSLNKNAEQEFVPTSKLLYTAKVAISGFCANDNQIHGILNFFFMCGEQLSSIILCEMASHNYNFIIFYLWLNMESSERLIAILFSFSYWFPSVKGFLGRKGNYFPWLICWVWLEWVIFFIVPTTGTMKKKEQLLCVMESCFPGKGCTPCFAY